MRSKIQDGLFLTAAGQYPPGPVGHFETVGVPAMSDEARLSKEDADLLLELIRQVEAEEAADDRTDTSTEAA